MMTVEQTSFTSHIKEISSLLSADADIELDHSESHDENESASSSSSSSSANQFDGEDRHNHKYSEKGDEGSVGKIHLSNQSHDTVATLPDEDDLSSERNDPDDCRGGSYDKFDDDLPLVPGYEGKQQEKVGFECKSLASISSKPLSSTMDPASSKSLMSHSSQSSSSSRGVPVITDEDCKALQEQLTRSLEQERVLLRQQQKLILELESLEQSIIKSESEERIARLAIQQAQIIRLMQINGEGRDSELITIHIPS